MIVELGQLYPLTPQAGQLVRILPVENGASVIAFISDIDQFAPRLNWGIFSFRQRVPFSAGGATDLEVFSSPIYNDDMMIALPSFDRSIHKLYIYFTERIAGLTFQANYAFGFPPPPPPS